MTTPLTLNTDRLEGGPLVLVARGEIDLSNVDTFAQALTGAISEAVDTGAAVTVDLSAVQYLDSCGIDALFTHADHIRLVANRLIMPVLTICGLTELATVEPAPPER
jgi:anti-anti-sigma factor